MNWIYTLCVVFLTVGFAFFVYSVYVEFEDLVRRKMHNLKNLDTVGMWALSWAAMPAVIGIAQWLMRNIPWYKQIPFTVFSVSLFLFLFLFFGLRWISKNVDKVDYDRTMCRHYFSFGDLIKFFRASSRIGKKTS